MASEENPFSDIVIPTTAEVDAYQFGPAPAIAPVPVKKPVKKSGKAGKTGKKKSAPLPEKTMTARYDELGLFWERSPLHWNPAGTDRKGNMGCKAGLKQHCGKSDTALPAVLLHLENLLAIDIDGDCEECKSIYDLCEAQGGMKAKTRKGHHFIFKAHEDIKNLNGTRVEIDTKTGKSSVLFVEPTFYNHPTEGVVTYKWERFPAKIEDIGSCPKEVIDWLLKNGYGREPMARNVIIPNESPALTADPDDDDAMTITSVMTAPLPAPLTVLEQVENLCSCLSADWLDQFNNWIRLCYCLKNIDASAEMKEIMLKHSRRATKYDNPRHIESNGKIWDGLKNAGRSGMGSLKHFAKKCNPEKYFNDAKNTYWNLINCPNANAFCEVFYNAMAGDIIYSHSHKCFYVYDERETLWKMCEGDAYINFLFVEVTSAIYRKMLGDIPPATNEEEAMKNKEKQKVIGTALKTCGGGMVVLLVKQFLPALCRGEDDPAKYFNQNPDLFPLANGVWKFSEKKLIKYERDFYFTFKVDIPYNPKADMSLIEKACNDWFNKDKEVCEFIQYWIGYCLTGFRNRQDFMLVWGTSAGNGKSLLWGDIMDLLLGGTKGPFYATLGTGALAEGRTGNNDEIYNLNGKRYAFLSEPRKGKGTKLDSELIKNLTGDKSITAEAKYKNAITFNLLAKFAMACNIIPDLPMEEKGMNRRVNVAEQNTAFLDADAYAKTPQHLKDEGKVQLKDDAFISEMMKNSEGIMRWALIGATHYVDNPRLPTPEAMAGSKDKAVGECDALGNWIRASLRNLATLPKADQPPNWERKNLKFKTIKESIRNNHLSVNVMEKGFNRVLKTKLESLGFTVGGREEKGDQYVKCADEIPEENTFETNEVFGGE